MRVRWPLDVVRLIDRRTTLPLEEGLTDDDEGLPVPGVLRRRERRLKHRDLSFIAVDQDALWDRDRVVAVAIATVFLTLAALLQTDHLFPGVDGLTSLTTHSIRAFFAHVLRVKRAPEWVTWSVKHACMDTLSMSAASGRGCQLTL